MDITSVSRGGVNVQTGVDNSHILNPAFPSLKLEATGTYDVVIGEGIKTIYTHNLGYFPLFFIYAPRVNITPDDPNPPIYDVDFTDWMLDPNRFSVEVNDTELRIDTDSGWEPVNTTIRYDIYRLNLFSEYDSGNIIATPASIEENRIPSFTVSEEGKDALTTDRESFVTNNTMRTFLVHKIKNFRFLIDDFDPMVEVQYAFEHGLPYPPLCFMYERMDSIGYARSVATVGTPVTGVSNTDVELYTTAAQYNGDDSDISFVVLKDPVNLVS